ncbi:unnamed protein product [Spirodela intermedia]|uniref:Uncharacterized protein n=1 Tax=Spirodela intermedia TaxID=51605 RepID=A0A7I8JBN2_SPIIN|nr:unnamed protein product [Spirodela intermedia]CAA6667514.1 unnamed protein product [Spirodela intermedia]
MLHLPQKGTGKQCGSNPPKAKRSFILRSAQQEEALHRIWYALRRWRLVSRRIVLFPTTACSSINRR